MNAATTPAAAGRSDRTLANVAAVVGVGNSDYRADYKADRPVDSFHYGAIAFARALADAGVPKSAVDGLVVGGPTSYERASELYGVHAKWGCQADSSEAVVQAVMAIKAGLCEVVAIVYGNNQRKAKIQYGGPQAMGGDSNLSYVYHSPWGLTSQGSLYALMHRRYMELNGTTEKDLGYVSVGQRAWATHNPNAIMKDRPITMDDYLCSPYVTEPLHLYDYCLINDGGTTMIIMEAGRAKREGRKPVMIKAMDRYDLHDQSTTLKPRLMDFYHPGHSIVAKNVYDQLGAGPESIDAALVYDSFSVHIPVALEGFGFCKVGEAGKFFAEKGIGPGGKLPVNTHGGHLSESYMQGWAHQIEAVRQIRGEAGLNVPNCRHVQYMSDVVGRVYSIIYGAQ